MEIAVQVDFLLTSDAPEAEQLNWGPGVQRSYEKHPKSHCQGSSLSGCDCTSPGGAAALAQGTWEQIPNGDQNPNAPALHGPDSTQMAQVGEMEVLNGPVSFHTRNYLSFGLLANIRTNWRGR